MPGKQTNRFANVGAVVTAGPFKLKAGDTTSFDFAILGTTDSTAMDALVRNVIDNYLSFYAGPQACPAPVVTAVEIRTAEAAERLNTLPRVQIFYSDAPEHCRDAFLLKQASLIENTALDTLNPGLVDTLRSVANQNFAELWIFKSCDNGATFTADNDCVGDPSIGPTGAPIGVGWRPYRIVKADANGNIPNVFVDDNVIGGRTYLYSFVTRTRGFKVPIREVVSPGDTVMRILTLADTITSALQRSGPTTAKVYVPIARRRARGRRAWP
jgi:hypothetical protein